MFSRKIQMSIFLFWIFLIFISPLQTLAQSPEGEESGSGYQGINLGAPLPGLSRVNNLGDYIAGIYNYAIGTAAILAGIMIMVGGLRWLTAAGNASAIDSAKKTISGALIGLILVFGSYVILNTINPELIKLRVPNIRSVPRQDLTLNLLGATNCTPGSLGCTCRGNDPETPNACDSTYKCVATRFIFATDESAVASDIRTGAIAGGGGAALVTRSPLLTVIGATTGVLVTGISSAGQTLYKCTDGRDASPCDDNEDCQSRHCQEYYHLCYRPPVELGGICNNSADCAGGNQCEGSSENIVEALGIQGIPKFCRGEGVEGDRCSSNNDCEQGLTCLLPPDRTAFGRCRDTRQGQTEENDPCVLTADGGITPPACAEGNEFGCYYCPAAGEPGTAEGRFWTRLRQETPRAERRVGQCKSDSSIVRERCAQ